MRRMKIYRIPSIRFSVGAANYRPNIKRILRSPSNACRHFMFATAGVGSYIVTVQHTGVPAICTVGDVFAHFLKQVTRRCNLRAAIGPE